VPRLGDQSVADKLAEARSSIAKSYAHLPIKTYPWLFPERAEVAGFYFDWITHHDRDAYWRQWSIRERYGDVKIPALNLAGWYDVFLNGSVENFVGMRRAGGSDAARNGQRLVVRPYVHIPWDTKSGDVDFGTKAANTTIEEQVRFFDFWLKGKANGLDKEPPVRLFVMGANTWREAEDWLVPGTQFTSFYLRSRGQANSLFGNGQLTTDPPGAAESPDHYLYDPSNPVPSKGGHSCCFAAVAPVGPYDQTDIERRADVLVYSTPPLTEAVEVTGPVTVKLFAATSAPDTDWTAKLVDVEPGGKIINLNKASSGRAIATAWKCTNRSIRESPTSIRLQFFRPATCLRWGIRSDSKYRAATSRITIAISTPGSRSASTPRWSWHARSSITMPFARRTSCCRSCRHQ
jgi:putative CocE/NonD family hydrolase